MTKAKATLIISFTIILCIMTLGYAALKEQVDINGSTSIDSVYRVEISKIEQGSITGSAEVKDVPSYTGLTANFNVSLTTSADTIIYNIEISNLGTVDVRLNNTIITTEDSSKIKVIKSGITNGNILLAGESKVMTIKITYEGEGETGETTSAIKVNFDYTRLKGGIGEVVEENYPVYSIGDVVEFAGSNWYVIENSSNNEEHITVLKETVLTSEEMGEYAISSTNYTMAYYWSDTCHKENIYGYTDLVTSDCKTDYNDSKIKEMLENQYLPTLGSENLKEVNGYKIRLMLNEEYIENFGWNPLSGYASSISPPIPTWLYKNIGDSKKGVYSYYATTKQVSISGKIIDLTVYNPSSVRPVINLLKSSVQ